ncbi:MAG: hypothetical protein N3G22_04235 [Candidatus Micrarchaeota archaeon]|nr:hypothetical protein [Candidatus Micrarchaeota archaeon]
MAEINKGARGVFFSIGAIFLAIVLLSFASHLSLQSLKGRESAWLILEMEKTASTYYNIEMQMKKIGLAGANISVNNNSVLIEQKLPWEAQINESLDRFVQFEKNFSQMNVSIGKEHLANGSFVIRPVETTISQGSDWWKVSPISSPQSAGMLSAYDLELMLPVGSFSYVNWENVSNSSSDTMQVRIRIVASDYSKVWPTAANYKFIPIDKYMTSSLNVTDESGNLVARITFLPPASVLISYRESNIDLKASIWFSTPVYVETNDVVSVRSSVNKTGKLRIA